MKVSELDRMSNQRTQAYTPAVDRNSAYESPLRSRGVISELRPGESLATRSAGLFKSAKGDRYSYSLGNGSYIILEEVTNKTPSRPNESFVSAKELSNIKGSAAAQFLQVDDSLTVDQNNSPIRHSGGGMSRSSSRKVSRASAPRHTCSVKSPGRDFDLPK